MAHRLKGIPGLIPILWNILCGIEKKGENFISVRYKLLDSFVKL